MRKLNATKAKTILKIIIAVVIAIVIYVGAYNAGKSYVYSIDNYYFDKTEALLDSINKWDESFMDVIMETDVYYDYEEARDGIITGEKSPYHE